MSDHDVCAMYGKSGSGKEYRTEIDRRGLISNWSLVDAHQIALGMNACEVLAIVGTADSVAEVYQWRNGAGLWTVSLVDGRVANILQN
jgi:hypothetical protein